MYCFCWLSGLTRVAWACIATYGKCALIRIGDLHPLVEREISLVQNFADLPNKPYKNFFVNLNFALVVYGVVDLVLQNARDGIFRCSFAATELSAKTAKFCTMQKILTIRYYSATSDLFVHGLIATIPDKWNVRITEVPTFFTCFMIPQPINDSVIMASSDQKSR